MYEQQTMYERATNFLKTDIYSAKKQPWDVDLMEINMSRNKSKWKFRTEDKDGVEYAYINGYDFGDRLLEGVLFKIIIENNEFKAVDVEPGAKEYFSQLNQKKWLKEATDFAKQLDVFIAPDGKSDAWVVDEEGENPHI